MPKRSTPAVACAAAAHTWLAGCDGDLDLFVTNYLDSVARFGLGEVDAVEEVRIHWPDGTVESFGPREPGRVHRLARGNGNGEASR